MSERRSEKAMNAAAEKLAASGREAGQLAANWADNWNQINGRLVTMAQIGLRNSMQAAEQLRACQTPAELVDTQMRLARQAYDDYLEEARSLSELVVKLSSETLAAAASSMPQAR